MTTPHYSLAGKKVWVAGHNGMVGSALLRALADKNCEIVMAARSELDLRRQRDVEDWVAAHRPDVTFMAAAIVGGILANDTYPVEFLVENIQIETNIIAAAHANNVERFVFLGSSCIYPRLASQPMKETALLTGPLEPTNRWYAIAKIAGLMMTQAYRKQYGCDYIACMPTNLYGPGDNFDLESSHVLSALIVKAHAAKTTGDASFEIWGTGKPTREFLYVDDLADALVFLAENYSDESPINIGFGKDIPIGDLAKEVAKIIGFEGDITNDLGKPDGMPRKLMDSSRIHALGWHAQTSLGDGIAKTYQWYLDHHLKERA